MNAFLSSRWVVIFVVCICLAPACAKKAGLTPVSGKVTVDGQPVTSGQVSFFPMGPAANAPAVGLLTGTIEADGSYTIGASGNRGAPLGKYKVTVTPSMVPTGGTSGPAVAFDQRYRNEKTTSLEVEVVADVKPGQYDLKLTK